MSIRLSCGIVPAPNAPDVAARAEELGYHRAWFYDSPALYGDVWVAIARSLDRTQRIGVGTAVLVPSLRHVVATAAAIGSIEAQAPGRLVVALGTGFTGRALFGEPAMTWRATRDYVSALRALLRGEDALVDGRVCRLMHPAGLLAKRPIETPLVVAASGPRGLAIANEIGDGVMCAGVIPEGVRDAMLLSFGTVLRDGEELASPRVIDAIGPAIAVIYHAAYQTGGAEAVDPLPGGAGWRAEIERFAPEVRHLHVHEGHIVELTERDRRHIHPALGATTFTGTPAQLRERLAAYEAQGVSELIYAPIGPDVEGELHAMREALEGAVS
jgi:5,10-methylenetetrahydromethanopterin reductase